MENIQESQNATVITENTKLMMRIAGVLFALLAVVQLINGFEWRNSGYYIYYHNYIFLYRYIDIALLVVEIIFSIACIIQKKIFFFDMLVNYIWNIFSKSYILYNKSDRSLR